MITLGSNEDNNKYKTNLLYRMFNIGSKNSTNQIPKNTFG